MLDLLCTLLLAVPPGLTDLEGARYVRWACRHLQVRPHPHGPASLRALLAPWLTPILQFVSSCLPSDVPPPLAGPATAPQGGKVRRSSPFWPTFHDCEVALRSLQQPQAGGWAAPSRPEHLRDALGASPSVAPQQLARRSLHLVPQSLAAIAGGVATAFAGASRSANMVS